MTTKKIHLIIICLLITSFTLFSQTTHDGMDDADRAMEAAGMLFMSHNYVEALNAFKLIIETPELQKHYSGALVGISSICIATKEKELGLDYKEIFEYLKAHTKDDENAPVAYKIIYASTLSGLRLYYEAISEFEELLEIATITDYDKERILSWLWVIRLITGDVDFNDGRDDAMRLLITVNALFESGHYRQGLDYFQLILTTPGFDNNQPAHTYAKEILEYLKVTTNYGTEGKTMYVSALIIFGYYEIDYWNEAISEIDKILEMSTTDEHKQALLRWFNWVYGLFDNDSEKVAELLGKIADLEKKLNAVVSVDNPTDLPTDYSLSQNYPNPFNPTTTIQYSIPKDEFVKLAVYDITGKVVKELVNGHKTAGRYSVEFNASNYSSGIYYYRLETSQYNSTQKMMLIK